MKLEILLERLKGENNSNWKGSQAKMRALHMRQESKKGKASQYKCIKCGKKAEEWAMIKGTKKFKPMCKSCHTKYDGKEKNFI